MPHPACEAQLGQFQEEKSSSLAEVTGESGPKSNWGHTPLNPNVPLPTMSTGMAQVDRGPDGLKLDLPRLGILP